jgi:hypothetical protein
MQTTELQDLCNYVCQWLTLPEYTEVSRLLDCWNLSSWRLVSTCCYKSMGMRLCLWTAASSFLLFIPPDDIVESHGVTILTGNSEELREIICLSATLSTTNPTCAEPGTSPGLRSDRSGTNRLCPWHGRSYPLNRLLSSVCIGIFSAVLVRVLLACR